MPKVKTVWWCSTFLWKLEIFTGCRFLGPSLDFIKKIMSIQTEQPLPTHTPFLNSNSNQSHQHPQENNNDYETQTPLDDVLASLEVLLTLLSFNQSSLLSFTVSWTTFAVVGVVAPLLALQVYDTDKNQIKGFEIGIVAFQTCLAAVSLICLSHNLQKYGLNRFLLVDHHAAHMPCFHHDFGEGRDKLESNFDVFCFQIWVW